MKTDLTTTSSGLSRTSVVMKQRIQMPRRPCILNATSAHSLRPSSGFTLIEMLVCIAIMAVIVAMTLPAIQNARESARATYCRSNLAQLGEAFHAYHMTHLSLPSGSVDLQSPAESGPDRFVWGWALQLLPQLDEQSIATRLNTSRGVADSANQVFLDQAPEYLRCPSGTGDIPIGYAGCHHDTLAPIQADNNGVLTLNSHVRFNELVDGLHQTILLGEAADVRWAEGTAGSLRNFGIGYGPAYVKTYFRVDPESEARRNSILQDTIREELNQPSPSKNAPTDEDDDSDELSGEGAPDSPQSPAQPDESVDSDSAISSSESDEALSPESDQFASTSPPTPDASKQLARQYRETGFWPIHRNTGNFLMVDGSVRTVSRAVQLDVLRRLANRHDHQPVGEF